MRSRNSDFLYQLNSLEGTINAFRVERDGRLSLVQTVSAAPPNPNGATIGLAAR